MRKVSGRTSDLVQKKAECEEIFVHLCAMELFYAKEAQGSVICLDQEESGHCIKVLRHRVGDEVNVIDGHGTMLRCRIADANAKGAQLEVLERTEGFGVPQYHLTLACCPTKNNDRFEWLVEKATEMGVDRIVPLIGERSERKVYKSDRARRIALSAAKQSLKALVPEITEPITVKEFLQQPLNGIGLIAYCFDDEISPRASLGRDDKGIVGRDDKGDTPPCHTEAPQGPSVSHRTSITEAIDSDEITILIGPEGDFSPEEAAQAIAKGYRPIHLGPSRLRTETAALAAVSAVYLKFIGKAYVSED